MSGGIFALLVSWFMVAMACPAAGLWDMDALAKAPGTFAAEELSKPEVKAIFFEGEPWQGKETRVFAYYGFPKMEPGTKVPGMVLVHGGGGSAFSEWVKLWNSRGYAAIAMDTCGAISGEGYNNHKRHEHGGPQGWGGFEQTELPEKDQWSFHAVSAVIRAHSLLRSFPEVDDSRIGITGVSWGGYLTCVAAGVDGRFKFAAPVYGCGFLQENSAWLEQFQKMGEDKADEWTRLWDPSSHLPSAKMPMLFVTGTNDFAFPMDSLKKSHSIVGEPVTLSIPGNMPHGQPQGAEPQVIHTFADQISKGGEALPFILGTKFAEGRLEVSYSNKTGEPVASAELLFTADKGNWKERKWSKVPASSDAAGKAEADVPAEATAFFINLNDKRGFVISSPHHER